MGCQPIRMRGESPREVLGQKVALARDEWQTVYGLEKWQAFGESL